MKIREKSIKMREEQEQKKLQQQLDHNKVSPRTFNRKKLELESWVTIETNKIKKEKESYEGHRQRDRNEQYLLNVHQDFEQINKLIGSARSSQKSKHPPRPYIDDVMASSQRDGINSYRVEIDSQRKSHRVEENKIIEMIYEKKGGDKYINNNESSSQSRGKKEEPRKTTLPDSAPSNSQRSQSQPNSNNYGSQSQQPSSYRSQYDDQDYNNLNEGDEIPDFGVDVNVISQPPKVPSKQQPVQPQKDLTIDLAANTKHLANEKSEQSLNRTASQ